MKFSIGRNIASFFLLISWVSLSAQPPATWSVRMAKSEIKRYPVAWQYESQKPSWGYHQGVVFKAMLDLWKHTGDRRYYDYAFAYGDSVVGDNGRIKTYKAEAFNIDMIAAGKVLFQLYKETGNEKFAKAIHTLRDQMRTQPRTSEGGFWHKLRYPHQMWLDGLYMGSPFLAQYARDFHEPDLFDEVVKQATLMAKHTYDPKTGLYYHAWDESKEQRWANKQTGQSPNFWGRSMGWFAMALVDMMDFLPEGHAGRKAIIQIINRVALGIKNYQDPRSGVWYQVMDQGKRAGNYLESTASGMFVYFLYKGMRKGYLNNSYRPIARKGFEGLIRNFIREELDGTISLTKCCAVAGLGGDPYRDGSYEYYINERIRDNDPKGTGPFIWASMEYEIDNRISGKNTVRAPELQRLRCEMLINPLGIDGVKPRLSWEITGDERDIQQRAYQVLVASSKEMLSRDEGDLWNSGKVSSDQSVHVTYNGLPLQSRTTCYWKVKTWTTQGESMWSEPACWIMGLSANDWQAKWIGLDRAFPWDSAEHQFSRLSARYFRKEFHSQKQIKKAMTYIVGLGLYELFINGQRVGDQVLAPVPTDYTQSVKYNTFDVTSNLRQGNNVIATTLGNGRYFTMRQAYKPYKIHTFGFPKMLVQLEIEFEDGTRQTIISDHTWKVTADGPVRTNNEYDGEEYDAAKEIPGWSSAEYDDAQWLNAEIVEEPGGKVQAQMNENMKVMETIKPVAIRELRPSTFILDMGQNMVGWLRIRVNGKKGDKITLRFAETLQSNGELFTKNLRDAKVTDVYKLKGEGEEIWEPSFVYHGFRYVEITGYPEKPEATDFEGKVVYDAMQTTGSFETSNTTINQIYKNAYWGIRGNYKGMPVDCPQRNERQPWLGDRATGAYGESFIFDNARLYAKWLDDIEQSQTAEGRIPDVAPNFWFYYKDNMTWPGTYLMIANMLYRQFGDRKPIEKHYQSMRQWLVFMEAKYMDDYIVSKDSYGDWCVPPESKALIHSQDPARKTDGTLIATAYYYYMLDLMQQFATHVNKPGDAQAFASLSQKIRSAFNSKFLDEKTAQYSNGTVTANILPLSFGMVPEPLRKKLFGNIVNKIINEDSAHISTGVIGTQWLMRELTKQGRADIAYRMATNRDYPSWGYMVEQGATTIWELWNGDTADPSMNSHNHVMLLGDLIIWYFEHLAGIKTADGHTAFKQIEMKPSFVEGLDFVKASYHSVHGVIKSYWLRKDKQFTWNITVPGNTKAIVYIPARSEKHVLENGKKASSSKGVKYLRMEGDKAVFEVGSGDYAFTSTDR